VKITLDNDDDDADDDDSDADDDDDGDNDDDRIALPLAFEKQVNIFLKCFANCDLIQACVIRY